MKRLEIKKVKGSGPTCGLRIQNSFFSGPHQLSWPICPLVGLGNTEWEAGSLFPIHRPFRTRRIVFFAILGSPLIDGIFLVQKMCIYSCVTLFTTLLMRTVQFNVRSACDASMFTSCLYIFQRLAVNA